MSRSTKSTTKLRVFLDQTIKHARSNTHAGTQRSQDLKRELQRIGNRVDKTLDAINKDAQNADDPNEDSQVLAKLEQTMEVLSDEMMQLATVYHRSSDINMIRRFIDDQRDIVHASMYGVDGSGVQSKTLDGRIIELHSLMSAERKRIRRTGKSERIKFWVSIVIALTSLGLSAYALLAYR